MENKFELPPILTAEDIMIYLKISKSKAYGMFKLNGFPTIIIGGNKRVNKDDFLNWLNGQKVN